jgi:hypothetical protein
MQSTIHSHVSPLATAATLYQQHRSKVAEKQKGMDQQQLLVESSISHLTSTSTISEETSHPNF